MFLLGAGSGLTPSVQAAVLSWSGASLAGANWNDAANWGFAGTPTNGDTLIFPGGAPRPTNTNDIPGLTLSQLRFVAAIGGYSIYGNAFTLTNSIAATNTAGANTILADIAMGGTNLSAEVGGGASLTLSNSLSGSASLTKFGAGTLIFSGSTGNTYTNATFVNAGTLLLNKTPQIDSSLHGPLIIGDGIGGANSDVVVLANNEQLSDTVTPVTVNSSGLFNLNGIGEYFGSLSGSGNVTLGGAVPRIGNDGNSTTFTGVISGAGGVIKRGSGTQTFTGDNTYTGVTEIDVGTLIINGSQPQSPAEVFSPGTLGGSGTVGIITTSGGNIAPGSSPGILTCSNVTLNASAVFQVDLNGPVAGVNYDQLNVRGTNNLAGAVLSVNLNLTTPVGLSNELVIINNDGAEPITGTFAGYPDGTTVTGLGYKLLLHYNGGDGNDVSFTVIQLPGDTAGSTVSGGNGNGLIDPNECNNLYVVITNKTGTLMTGINATLSSATPEVVVTQPYSSYPNAPANAKSTNVTAFQISTLPGFVCGSNITLNLALTTASHGAFTAPTTLGSGVVSLSPTRYDVGTSTNIPDVGTMESTNTVSGFASPIAKVTVSLWITHTLDSDLSISLVSPNNVIVDLSSGNGAGANFGSSCAPDGNRTTFDDSAATAITAGSPPYVGTFRPEASLAALNGGTANGDWRLRITDSSGGTLGTLRCWSLFLYPLTCAPGGGLCDLCPNTTIFGAIGQGSLIQSDRLTRDGFGASCGSPKGCPGDVFHGGQEYDAHTFRNGPSDACITVTLTAPGTDLMSVAYLGAFDPNDHCTNYLADSGDSTALEFPIHPISYSINVASNAVFVVTVNGVDGARGPYQLSVTGGDCRPALNITSVPTSNVRLDWPTWAGGYNLEGTPALTAPSWSTVTNSPVVTGGRYAVTNSAATSNKFYRLHKP